MSALIWNIRGFDAKGRHNQLRDFLRFNKFDIICLQETIRQEFSLQELENLVSGEKFFWAWLPANGHSGGLLLGIRDKVL
jgi:exonuclease III